MNVRSVVGCRPARQQRPCLGLPRLRISEYLSVATKGLMIEAAAPLPRLDIADQ